MPWTRWCPYFGPIWPVSKDPKLKLQTLKMASCDSCIHTQIKASKYVAHMITSTDIWLKHVDNARIKENDFWKREQTVTVRGHGSWCFDAWKRWEKLPGSAWMTPEASELLELACREKSGVHFLTRNWVFVFQFARPNPCSYALEMLCIYHRMI